MSYENFVPGTDYYLFRWNNGNPEQVVNQADATLKFNRLENDIYVFNDSTGGEVPFTKNLEEPYIFEIDGAQFFFPERSFNTGENYYVKQISANSEGGETISIVTDSGGNPEYFLKYGGYESVFFIFTDRGDNLLYFKPTLLPTITYPNHVIFQMFVFIDGKISETESYFLFLGIVNNPIPSEEAVVPSDENVGSIPNVYRSSAPSDIRSSGPNDKPPNFVSKVKSMATSLWGDTWGSPTPSDEKKSGLPEKHKHPLLHKTYTNPTINRNLTCSVCGETGKSASWFYCTDPNCNNYRECVNCYANVSGRIDTLDAQQFPIRNPKPYASLQKSSNSNSNSNSNVPAEPYLSYKANTVATVGWSASDLGLDTTKETMYLICDIVGHSEQSSCRIKESVAGVLAKDSCYTNWVQPDDTRTILTSLTTPNACNWRNPNNHEGTKYKDFEKELFYIVEYKANPIGEILKHKISKNNDSIPQDIIMRSALTLENKLSFQEVTAEANSARFFKESDGNFAAYMYVKGALPEKAFGGNDDPTDTAWPDLPYGINLPVIIMSSRVLIQDIDGSLTLVNIPISKKNNPIVLSRELIIPLKNGDSLTRALELIDIKMRQIAVSLTLGDVNFVPIVNLNGCNRVPNDEPITPSYPRVYEGSGDQPPYYTTIARSVDVMNTTPLENIKNQKALIEAQLRSVAKGTILKNDPELIEEIITEAFQDSNLPTASTGYNVKAISESVLEKIKEYSQDPEFIRSLGRNKKNPYLTKEELAEHFKESPSHVNDTREINIDDKVVYIRDGKLLAKGMLKWAGNIEGVGKNLAGICLAYGYTGKNDGTLGGIKYFDCPYRKGLFVPQQYIFHENDVKIPEKGGNLIKKRSKIITRRGKKGKKRILTRKIMKQNTRKIKKNMKRKIKKQNTRKIKK